MRLRSDTAVRARILIVEDDITLAECVAAALRQAQIDTCCVASAGEALNAARIDRFDLLLIDHCLPDMLGTDLIRTLQMGGEGGCPAFIVASGYMTVPLVVESMKLGAVTVLEKPLDIDRLVTAVRSFVGHDGPAAASPGSAMGPPRLTGRTEQRPSEAPRQWHSPTERWASLVWRAVHADFDPKTLSDWARLAHVSRSVLCESCRLVRIAPHDARDFARIMRAILHSSQRWQPEAVINVAETRTLKRILKRAGLLDATRVPPIDEFLLRQLWIPIDNPGLVAFRTLFLEGAAPATAVMSSSDRTSK